MCVKGLPPVLMIHLKRFGFDWEAGRAIKSDDYFEVIVPTPKYSNIQCIIVSMGAGYGTIHCSWYQPKREW